MSIYPAFCSRLIVALLFLSGCALADPAEVRGVWIDRSSLVSREEIRVTMRQLSESNFNLVLVNVWSRGYPLWQSRVFEKETGMLTDPGYAGRDVLLEVIEEARPFGLAVMPWVEYGFIGGYSGYFPGQGGRGPIFDVHPDWIAKTRQGETRFTAPGGFFYWMIHTHPDVQSFIISLMEELGRNYETIGIQFDRSRYPQLDCGYDDFTINLYRREHNGSGPPADPANSEWVRWRADKINLFVKTLYHRLKAVNRALLVSNAPGVYPYAYVNFAQDYPGWMRDGALDFTVPQIYRKDIATYLDELNRQIAAVPSIETFVPGTDITNSNPEELVKMIEAGREKNLPGVVVWYYRGLKDSGAFEVLRRTVFRGRARMPWAMSRSNIRLNRSIPGTLPAVP
ncbi:MAG: family 10 glycosylhydrolase [Acidobacteria bacterium]|nr:family 10 glycosylhydrolase [Acidobacteriota bacterium]